MYEQKCIKKAGIKIDNIPFDMVNFDSLEDTYSQNIIKLLYDFHNILIQVTEKMNHQYYHVI